VGNKSANRGKGERKSLLQCPRGKGERKKPRKRNTVDHPFRESVSCSADKNEDVLFIGVKREKMSQH